MNDFGTSSSFAAVSSAACSGHDGRRVSTLQSALPSPADIESLADVFRLMGDPGRMRILSTLFTAGEVCVHDLADVSGLSQSSVSQALRLMRARRVVAVRRFGRLAYYRLADSHVRQLLDLAFTHVGHATVVTGVPHGHGRGAGAPLAS